MGSGEGNLDINAGREKVAGVICALACLFVAVMMPGCGSSGETTGPSKKVADTVNTQTSGSPSNVPSAANTSNSNTSIDSNSQSNLGPAANRRKVVPVQSDGPPPQLPVRPAPENSGITTSMNNEGMVVETRYFKNHPQLSKVEVLWRTPKDKKVTIFLKNGGAVEVPGDKFENLSTVSTSSLLELAGFRVSRPAVRSDPRKADQMKKEH